MQVSYKLHDDQLDDLTSLFRLLGDPNRVRILIELAQADADDLCVHEIAERVGTTDTKVSQALRLLRTAGVVRTRRDGRHIHYRLDDDHVRTLIQVSIEHVEHIDDDDREPDRSDEVR